MGLMDGFPRIPAALLGILQLALAAAAIGLEVGSIFVDLAHGTIWAGFWSGLVYIITGLLLLLMACCCCRSACGRVYGLIMMALAAAVAIAFIYFESYFINNICTCYLGNTLCCAIGSISDFTSSNYTSILDQCTSWVSNSSADISALTCRTTPTGKLPYVKAQLATGVGMVVTCALYIIIFILQCLGICCK